MVCLFVCYVWITSTYFLCEYLDSLPRSWSVCVCLSLSKPLVVPFNGILKSYPPDVKNEARRLPSMLWQHVSQAHPIAFVQVGPEWTTGDSPRECITLSCWRRHNHKECYQVRLSSSSSLRCLSLDYLDTILHTPPHCPYPTKMKYKKGVLPCVRACVRRKLCKVLDFPNLETVLDHGAKMADVFLTRCFRCNTSSPNLFFFYVVTFPSFRRRS